MKASIDYIKRKFNEYNRQCFGGQLTLPPIRLSQASTYLGQVRFRKSRNRDGSFTYSGFTLYISITFDMPESKLQDVILHEMIHLYILSRQLRDTAPHGKLFIQMMDSINKRFGHNISISHKNNPDESDSCHRTDKRQRIVCVVRFNDGSTGVAVVAQTMIFQLWDEIESLPNVARYNWFSTTNPYFARYPRARSLKIYLAQPDQLEQHIQNAIPLERNGISPKSKPLQRP